MENNRIKVVGVSKWIEENKSSFIPPVCNKLMHTGGQLDVMFVGGPNSRKDYHIEAGEELFLQIKGDMLLKVLERGEHKDIIIKEGEMFLLPRAIPHSPQRFANTVGLVLERRRHELELDGLRYFTEKDGLPQKDTLYETWFSWGQSMPELFKQFFASKQYETGIPIPDTIPNNPPIEVDTVTVLPQPFSISAWIQSNQRQLDEEGRLPVFDCANHQMQVYVCGKGETAYHSDVADMWIWQMDGEGLINCDKCGEVKLSADESALIPIGCRFTLKQKAGGIALVCYQDPTKTSYYPGR